jgi:hypothetical protein
MIPIKAESIPGEFWDTLGKYVYGYKDEQDQWKYIGKGTGSRVFSHTKTKGYDLEDAWIIACNLEDFDNGDDSSCHSLETLLISLYQPEDNAVAGRYQENIIMTSLRGLITQYQDEQRNNHFEVAELILRHQDSLSNIGAVSSSSSGWKITSKSLGRGTYVNVHQADDDGFRVEIGVSRNQDNGGEIVDSYEASLKELLGEDEVVRTSHRDVSFWCATEEFMVEKWAELTGA